MKTLAIYQRDGRHQPLQLQRLTQNYHAVVIVFDTFKLGFWSVAAMTTSKVLEVTVRCWDKMWGFVRPDNLTRIDASENLATEAECKRLAIEILERSYGYEQI